VLCVLFSAFFFATQSVFVKKLSLNFTSEALVFFRAIFSATVIFLWLIYRTEPIFIFKKKKILLLRGVSGCVGLLCSFVSIKLLALPIAAALAGCIPLFVIFLSPIFLKESLPKRALFLIPIVFIGFLLTLYDSHKIEGIKL